MRPLLLLLLAPSLASIAAAPPKNPVSEIRPPPSEDEDGPSSTHAEAGRLWKRSVAQGKARERRSSGQRIRLRSEGNRTLGEGRVEVWVEGAGWGLVCDDLWEAVDADVACRQLGFHRGAERAVGGGNYGAGSLGKVLLDDLACGGEERTVHDCPRAGKPDCDPAKEAAGLICRPNFASRCDQGGVLFKDKCYYFYSEAEQVRSFAAAKAKCEGRTGGSLAAVQSQAESDFVSEVLFVKWGGGQREWYTAGMEKEGRWRWQVPGGVPASSFAKWGRQRGAKRRPGKGAPDELLRRRRCLLLSLDGEADDPAQAYFFWRPGDCQEKRPFVCQAPPKDVGCVSDPATYAGRANTTQLGIPCVSWSSPGVLRRGKVFDGQEDWRHNFCRNPDGDSGPWCMVSEAQFDLCDIPPCQVKSEKSLCKEGEVRCGTAAVCVAKDFVCDYDKDCPNGFDEAACTDFLKGFAAEEGRKLTGAVSEVWTFIPHPQGCARRCREAKGFVCLSFSYADSDQTCVLSAKLHAPAELREEPGSTYYHVERQEKKTPRAESCGSGEFRCGGGACVVAERLCDGKADCADGADERNCTDFAVRLSGRPGADGEGIVEIRAFGKWGLVCDDDWDINDATVLCKELGFSGAAKALVGQRHSGPTALGYQMDEVDCRGTEASLAACTHNGWGRHDCGGKEAAGAVCSRGKTACSGEEMECGDGSQCIRLSWMCDGDADCADGSDEDAAKCAQALHVRLVDGPKDPKPGQLSGRLEIRRHGFWGTVCDDGFDENDAQVVCRMLGFAEGSAHMHGGGVFPGGQGPIWLDEVRCEGSEASLEDCRLRKWGYHDCQHSEDVAVTCSAQKSPGAGLADSGECGRRFVHSQARDPRKPLLARVVGGFEAKRGAYPWTAAIRLKPDRHHCGAAVVSRFHLLSAAHCFEDEPNLKQYEVIVGDWDNRRPEGSEQTFAIESVTVYPEYENVLQHDIAIVKLKAKKGGRGIQFTDFVQPICLPSPSTPYRDGMKGTVSGWGSVGVHYPRRLQAASLPILSRDKCSHPNIYAKILSRTAFCAGFLRGGIDSCQGDSGGPFAAQIDGRFYLLGVISWGDGCAERDKPGIYTKIQDYLPWIRSHIEKS